MTYTDSYNGVHEDEPCNEYKRWPEHFGDDNEHLCWNCAWPRSAHGPEAQQKLSADQATQV